MSSLGFNTAVYHGESFLGELNSLPVKGKDFHFPDNEIRIHHLSSVSRCPPLSILQTVSSFSVLCKLESSSSPVEQSQLINLHASCFHERKTAVVLLGAEEIHLVAMPSKQKKFPCFWCFSVPSCLYDSCFGMLNLRCLSIVFDLDETLIVANTLKSFEDRIEGLKGWILRETDPIRVSGMTAELKRYADDRALLKQYADNDLVMDNGRAYKAQPEEVPPMSDNHDRIVRPIVRLQDKNVVFTRINPENRDTSVLVRLRPAWEDLRDYLIAKGRKRFEVYVCTMAERDYALEIWRLLDPEAHLIGSKQILDRVVCVKSGSKKSLLNVFRDGICHPKMAMVIDDRLNVWEDKDQSRVHVVPAFAPYYAPQAETANAVPVLCVARNVACNVRGGFFKEFDENLLRKIFELFYEDDVMNLPPSPDVSNYLISEDTGFVPNGNANAPIAEGMSGPEVEWRLNNSVAFQIEKNVVDTGTRSMSNVPEKRIEISQPPTCIPGLASLRTVPPSQKPSLLGPPGRRDGISSESDPDLKRRLLIMKHGQDVRRQSLCEPPLLSRFPPQISGTSFQPQGGWLMEDVYKGHQNARFYGSAQQNDVSKNDKQRVHQTLPGHDASACTPSTSLPHVPQVKGEEASTGNGKQMQNILVASQSSELSSSHNQTSSNSKELQPEAGKANLLSSLPIGVLQEIGRRCGSKVEFRSVVSTSKDLQFCVEVLFTGKKIGIGTGKTRKDAQQQAAENALQSLADKYKAFVATHSAPVDRDFDKLSLGNENGFLWDLVRPESDDLRPENGLPKESASEAVEVVAVGSTSSNVANYQLQKRAISPRLPQSLPSKRSKDELLLSPHTSFSRQQNHGHSIT